MMDEAIKAALEHDRLVDITTTGRKSGRPHQIEIALHRVEGRIYLSGRPGRRPKDWYLNLLAQPQFTLHVKQSAQADLVATATPVREAEERRAVLTAIRAKFGPDVEHLDQWVAASPLVRLSFDEA